MIGKVVSTRIREVRRALELTQEELASRSGLSTRTLASIEQQERLPSLEALSSIADGLGVPVAALVEATPSGEHRTALYQRAKRALATLALRDLRIAIRVLEAFAAETAKRRR